MTFSLTNCSPRKINKSSWFSFYTKIVSCYFPISIPQLLYWIITRCVSYPPLLRFFLVSPQEHHDQDIVFGMLYWYIGYKTDPKDNINVGIFVLWGQRILLLNVLSKEYYHDFFSSNGPNIILPCNFFKIWALLPKSYFSLHHKTHSLLHLYHSP